MKKGRSQQQFPVFFTELYLTESDLNPSIQKARQVTEGILSHACFLGLNLVYMNKYILQYCHGDPLHACKAAPDKLNFSCGRFSDQDLKLAMSI